MILGLYGTARSFPCIDLDVRQAAAELAGYLVGLGHRRVSYAGISRDKASLQHRRDGLDAGLRELGAGLVAEDLVFEELTVEAAFQGFLARWPAGSRQE